MHKEGRWCSWAFCAKAFAGHFSGSLLILTWAGMEAPPDRLHFDIWCLLVECVMLSATGWAEPVHDNAGN